MRRCRAGRLRPTSDLTKRTMKADNKFDKIVIRATMLAGNQELTWKPQSKLHWPFREVDKQPSTAIQQQHCLSSFGYWGQNVDKPAIDQDGISDSISLYFVDFQRRSSDVQGGQKRDPQIHGHSSVKSYRIFNFYRWIISS